MATSPHPPSPLQLPEEGLKGRVELKFFDGFNRGVACKLDSIGYKAMVEAFTQVDGAPHTLQAVNGKVMVIASRIACYCGLHVPWKWRRSSAAIISRLTS